MGRFWGSPILPLNALLLIGALATVWRDQLRRKWVIASAVLFFAALIWTGVWFVPQGVIPLMARGGEGMSPEEITSRASAWIFWDWFRMGLTCGAFLAMTKSLTSRLGASTQD